MTESSRSGGSGAGDSSGSRAESEATNEAGAVDYTQLFAVPMWGSVACFLILMFFYPSRSPRAETAS